MSKAFSIIVLLIAFPGGLVFGMEAIGAGKKTFGIVTFIIGLIFSIIALIGILKKPDEEPSNEDMK